MTVSRFAATAVACVAATVAAAPAEAALSLGVSTPTVAMSISPGTSATGSGTITVTPGLGTWRLTVADTSGNAGHLAPAASGCSGAEAQTVNALTLRVSGGALGTSSTGTVTVGSSAQTLATGTLGDTLSESFGLVVGNTERMPLGCVFSTTLTYTIQ